MKNFFMDVNFKRIVNAERRVNQGLANLTLDGDITSYAVQPYSHDFLRIANANAGEGSIAVTLPDATTLPLGFDIKVQRNAGFGLTLNDNGAGLLKTIDAGKTIGARLMANGTAAGTWLLYSVQEDAAFPMAYVANFDATTDWGTAAGGVYTISHSAATHAKGTAPLAVIYENDAGVIKPVGADLRIDATTGNISVVADETVDMRFAGRLVVVQ